MPRGHTDCCGSECKLFHLGSFWGNCVLNSVGLYILSCGLCTSLSETTAYKCTVWLLNVRSGVPWVVSGSLFFLARATGSLGFLVAVAGYALAAVSFVCFCWCLNMRLLRTGIPLHQILARYTVYCYVCSLDVCCNNYCWGHRLGLLTLARVLFPFAASLAWIGCRRMRARMRANKKKAKVAKLGQLHCGQRFAACPK